MASTCPCAGVRSEASRPWLRELRRGLRAAWAALLGCSVGLAMAATGPGALDDGLCQLQQGLVGPAAERLAAAHTAAPAGPARARAAAALGQVYLRLNHLDRAEPLLNEALAGLDTPRERAAAALDLGNLHLARRQEGPADEAWARALQLARPMRLLAVAAAQTAATAPLISH